MRLDQSGVTSGNTVAEKRIDFTYNAVGQFTQIDRYKDLDGGSTHLVAQTDYTYDDKKICGVRKICGVKDLWGQSCISH